VYSHFSIDEHRAGPVYSLVLCNIFYVGPISQNSLVIITEVLSIFKK